VRRCATVCLPNQSQRGSREYWQPSSRAYNKARMHMHTHTHMHTCIRIL